MDDTLLNSWLMWSSSSIKPRWWTSESWMLVFNWYNLHNWISRRIINSNHDDLWKVAYETYDYPRADWWNALSKYYRTKTIVLNMSLCSPTEEWLNDLIDELKFQTSKTQWFLDIIINWIVRRREATLISLEFWRKSFNVNRLWNVVLRFECVNPLSFTLSSNTNTYSWISGAYATEINYTWKVVAYPTIYINVSSETNLNTFSINMNWYVFTINEEISAWNLIQIDWESKLVRIDWNVISYDWPFPAIEPWLNHIEISLNSWAIANYDIVFIYKNLYL